MRDFKFVGMPVVHLTHSSYMAKIKAPKNLKYVDNDSEDSLQEIKR